MTTTKKLEEGQLVLCTVTKIVGTIVFVNIDEYDIEGTITFSEISPGRIRNIREFVVPGKKIVCKVLQVRPDTAYLSLRRVKISERNDLNEKHKREKSYLALFKTLLAEKADAIIKKIKEKEESLLDFIEKSKENSELLEKYLPKEVADKIIAISKEKKSKEIILSKKFSLSSKADNGIIAVKAAINESLDAIKGKDIEISYTAAGKYLAKLKSKDPKQANQQLTKFIEALEAVSKKKGCVFVKEK